MTQSIKVAIPMAGLGTRMRPHTWNKPKPLLPLAGRTVLDYVLDQFNSLPETYTVEYIFIVGAQGEQIEAYMKQYHPNKTVHCVPQLVMRGQSDALYLARQHLNGPMLMAFSDTLIETDLSFLKNETCDGVAWVKPVPDPRRFGVAQVNSEGRINRLIEKPQDMSINLALAGFYYFRKSEELIESIVEQMQRGITLKGEYYLVDAINIMLERGIQFRAEHIETWLDAGIPETLLDTNRYLLEHEHDNSAKAADRPGVSIIPPVFIHETAQIESSIIGPHVSVGNNCRLHNVIISNSIIGDNTQLNQIILEDTLLGSRVQLEGHAAYYNLGDNSKGTHE